MSERTKHDLMDALARVTLLAAWEADRAERDRLRTALDGQTDYTIRLQRIIERLAAGAPPVQAGDSECHLSAKATEVAARLATLESRVAALIEALRPFAHFDECVAAMPLGNVAHPKLPGDKPLYAIHTGTEHEASITLGHLRAARAALASIVAETNTTGGQDDGA